MSPSVISWARVFIFGRMIAYDVLFVWFDPFHHCQYFCSQVMSWWLFLGLNWHSAGLNVSCLSCLFLAALWSPAGKGLSTWLPSMWVFFVVTFHYHTVSWVMCGTWLHRFLTFAFYFTLLTDNMQFHLWDSNPQPFCLDSSTLPLGTHSLIVLWLRWKFQITAMT